MFLYWVSMLIDDTKEDGRVWRCDWSDPCNSLDEAMNKINALAPEMNIIMVWIDRTSRSDGDTSIIPIYHKCYLNAIGGLVR